METVKSLFTFRITRLKKHSSNHMRRKLTDTFKEPAQKLWDRSLAKVGLDYCGKLFHLENSYGEQKLFFQKAVPGPVAEKFFAWVKTEYEKNPVPKKVCLARR